MMRIFKFAPAAALFLAGTIAASAQTATLVDPAKLNEMAVCQATTIVQAKTYGALAALMRGTKPVAIDETTGHFLDRTADSVSSYGSSRLHDAEIMDGLAKRILTDANGYEAYKMVVDTSVIEQMNRVTASTFGPLPSSGPTEDLAATTDHCYDVVSSVLADTSHIQD